MSFTAASSTCWATMLSLALRNAVCAKVATSATCCYPSWARIPCFAHLLFSGATPLGATGDHGVMGCTCAVLRRSRAVRILFICYVRTSRSAASAESPVLLWTSSGSRRQSQTSLLAHLALRLRVAITMLMCYKGGSRWSGMRVAVCRRGVEHNGGGGLSPIRDAVARGGSACLRQCRESSACGKAGSERSPCRGQASGQTRPDRGRRIRTAAMRQGRHRAATVRRRTSTARTCGRRNRDPQQKRLLRPARETEPARPALRRRRRGRRSLHVRCCRKIRAPLRHAGKIGQVPQCVLAVDNPAPPREHWLWEPNRRVSQSDPPLGLLTSPLASRVGVYSFSATAPNRPGAAPDRKSW